MLSKKGGHLLHPIKRRKHVFLAAVVVAVILALLAVIAAVIVSADTSQCESDCTFIYDNVCHQECHGFNSCAFDASINLDKAKSSCNNWNAGFKRPYDHPKNKEIRCCEGKPYPKRLVKANPRINATSVAKATRLVWMDGRLVKMVVYVW